MARLLVMRRDLGPLKYEPGDIVDVFPDGHVFGTHEDPAVWSAAGFDPAEFPGDFWIIDVPGLPKEDVEPYLETAVLGYDEYEVPITGRRRDWTLAIPTALGVERNLKAKMTLAVFAACIGRK
jgi:hypothetical protein